MSHLHFFRLDKIKIDKTFVGKILENRDSTAIVDAVLGLAKSLGVTVVAEGIETSPVADLLTQKGCTFGQGYLFSRAVPSDAVVALLGVEPLDVAKAS